MSQGPGSRSYTVPDELIPSSQRSPVISCPGATRLPDIRESTCLSVDSQEWTSSASSPASTKVTSSSCTYGCNSSPHLCSIFSPTFTLMPCFIPLSWRSQTLFLSWATSRSRKSLKGRHYVLSSHIVPFYSIVK